MGKSVTLLLVLIFLTASCVIAAKPISAATPVENSWASKAPMHEARSNLGVAVVNGKIYAIGGNTQSGIVGTNEEYDPETDTWTYKTPMPTPRDGFGIAVYQNKIYCIGGVNCNATEVYDPATDTWETKASMPTARWQLEANVVNEKIYLMGGEPNRTLNEVYDPATNSWITKASIPYIEWGNFHQAGVYTASVVIDDQIYWIGVVGFFYSPLGFKLLNQQYSPENDSWSLRAPPPSYITPEVAGVTTGVWAPKRIYVFGDDGYNSVYDLASDTWRYVNRISPTRHDFGVAVVNDELYVIGGGYLWSASDANEQYMPFGYGTVPPVIFIASPESKNYTSSEVILNFSVNRKVEWMHYSLDGQDNVTLTGNTTLTGLSAGLHNVTVYARDEFENTGASETISFNVEVPEPFPTVPVAAASVACTVAAVGLLLVYFKKRRR
jgi:N-acetylneuraminic acid mutarotase